MATEKRLIDADVLMGQAQWFEYQCDDAGTLYDSFKYIDPEDVENAPTVDAVEVIHGEWGTKILCGGFAEEWGYVCSVCGCTVSDRSKLRFGKFATGNQKLNYCPNCGAKMDGDGNG